jgi:hypothetical protein
LVKTLVDGNKEAYYSSDFTGLNLSSGMYIYKLAVKGKSIVKKMLLLK